MIKTEQKLIKIGTSSGVTIPAKELARDDINVGDQLEVTIKKVAQTKSTEDSEVLAAAKKILERYKQDFENLAKR